MEQHFPLVLFVDILFRKMAVDNFHSLKFGRVLLTSKLETRLILMRNMSFNFQSMQDTLRHSAVCGNEKEKISIDHL